MEQYVFDFILEKKYLCKKRGSEKKVKLQVDTFLKLRVYCTPVLYPTTLFLIRLELHILWLLLQTKNHLLTVVML